MTREIIYPNMKLHKFILVQLQKYFGAIFFWCACISLWGRGQFNQILPVPNVRFLMHEINIGIETCLDQTLTLINTECISQTIN
jgi:hypothetical protein